MSESPGDVKLEPCRFCDGEAHVVSIRGSNVGARVICLNGGCRANGPFKDTPAEAIAAWNRRPAPPSSGITKAMQVFEVGLAKRRAREHGLPWRVAPWGDGSSPTGHSNIFSDAWRVTVASELLTETADFIVASVNALGNVTPPKFLKTYCSQCGGEFGPGDSGYSHCVDHEFDEAESPLPSAPPSVREDVIEECARVIEEKHTNNVGMVHPMAASDAAAIRALAEGKKQ